MVNSRAMRRRPKFKRLPRIHPMHLPQSPGVFYWTEWGREFEVYRRGRYLYVNPGDRGPNHPVHRRFVQEGRMTYRPSEKASVENPVVKLAQRLGIPVLKVNPLWAAGWPDRVFFVPGGRPLIIEFKRPGGKTSPKQEEVINRLRSLGYDVEIIDTKEQGETVLRSRLEADRVP